MRDNCFLVCLLQPETSLLIRACASVDWFNQSVHSYCLNCTYCSCAYSPCHLLVHRHSNLNFTHFYHFSSLFSFVFRSYFYSFIIIFLKDQSSFHSYSICLCQHFIFTYKQEIICILPCIVAHYLTTFPMVSGLNQCQKQHFSSVFTSSKAWWSFWFNLGKNNFFMFFLLFFPCLYSCHTPYICWKWLKPSTYTVIKVVNQLHRWNYGFNRSLRWNNMFFDVFSTRKAAIGALPLKQWAFEFS